MSKQRNISNFQPLEVVGRGNETQLEVGEYLNYLFQQDNKLSPQTGTTSKIRFNVGFSEDFYFPQEIKPSKWLKLSF